VTSMAILNLAIAFIGVSIVGLVMYLGHRVAAGRKDLHIAEREVRPAQAFELDRAA
jgi:hypothetical protein